MTNCKLHQRLKCLERRLDRYRFVTASLGAAVLGIIAIGATSPKETSDEIRTKKLVIVNDQGKEAIVLTAGRQGGALVLFDDTGHPMFMAGGDEAGGRLHLMLKNGQEYLHAFPEGTGGQLTLIDRSGKKTSVGAESAR